jgi:hypothetical protein
MRRSIACLTLTSAVASACSTTTTFHTRPAGAKLYIDGDECGVTPCVYHHESSVPRRHRIQIVKEGFRTYDFVVDREMSVLWGILLPLTYGLSTLWAFRLDDTYHFNLEPVAEK